MMEPEKPDQSAAEKEEYGGFGNRRGRQIEREAKLSRRGNRRTRLMDFFRQDVLNKNLILTWLKHPLSPYPVGAG
jgi:hypothetical protein